MFFPQKGGIRRPLCRRSSDDLMLARISFPFIPCAQAGYFRKFIDEFVFISRVKFIDPVYPMIEKLLRERKGIETPIERGKVDAPAKRLSKNRLYAPLSARLACMILRGVTWRICEFVFVCAASSASPRNDRNCAGWRDGNVFRM